MRNIYEKQLVCKTSRCIRGVLVKAGDYGAKSCEIKHNSGKPATTCEESCASSTCLMIVLRGQPAWFCALMLFNYSCFIVLGSGPVRNCLNYPATLKPKGCNGMMTVDLAS